MSLTRLLIRRHRATLSAWLLVLTGLCGGTVSSYQNTYATEQQRRTAVALAQEDRVSTLLYGRLPDSGNAAQMFTWELGAILSILTAVMAVLVTVAVTRAAEDDGTIELVRGCGVARRRPLHSALALLTGVALVLGVGCGAAVGLGGGHVEGVTWAGAMVFGATTAATFLVVSALTAVLAQVAATAGQARMLGLTAVGASFAVRAFGDAGQLDALSRLSPLGLRAAAEPFSADRWWAVGLAVLAGVALAALAQLLSDRREFGAGLVRRRHSRDSRLRLRTPVGLAIRIGRSSLLAWTVAVAAVGALLSSMGAGTVRQSQTGDLGGFLGSQLGTGDPAAAYLAYCNTVVGILVCAYAVLSVLAAQHYERGGLTDLVLAVGVRRWAPLAAQTLVTAAGCAVILVVTGTLSALIAPMVIDGNQVAVRAFSYAVGQWPAAVATAGCATLLTGVSARLAGLAWVPFAASTLFALLGNLLGIPQRIQDLGFLRHVPDIAGPNPRAEALLVLVALGLVLSFLGAVATTRRDVATD